jgi:hypothetical protein
MTKLSLNHLIFFFWVAAGASLGRRNQNSQRCALPVERRHEGFVLRTTNLRAGQLVAYGWKHDVAALGAAMAELPCQ